jgi:uncharacterized protein
MKNAMALLILLASVSANAASFDCDKAASTKERFICSEPAISALDAMLAKTYRDSLVGLTSHAVEVVRSGQRAWLAYWPWVCSQIQTSIKLDKGSVKCVSEQYEERISELAIKHFVNDKFRMYWVVSFDVMPTEKDDEYGPAKHELKYPQLDISNPQDPMSRSVLKINEWLGHDRANWKASLDNLSDSGDIISLSTLTEDILKRFEHSEFYGHGAVHPVSANAAGYFSISKNRVLRAEDILGGNRWVDTVIDIAYRQLANDLKDSVMLADKKDLREMIQDVGHWELQRDHLVLNFDVYQVAPYSEGSQAVKVPWSALSRHLTSYAQQQLPRITTGK